MPSGGDRSAQSEVKRRASGALCLDDPVHDAAVKLLAEGEAKEEIPALLEHKLTLEQLDELLRQPLVVRRLNWWRKQKDKEQADPESADECLSFVKQGLVRIYRNAAEDKSKIDALKALASVAIDERKNKPAAASASQPVNSALEKLSRSVEGADESSDQ